MDYKTINKELQDALGKGVVKVMPKQGGGFKLRFASDHPTPKQIQVAKGIVEKHEGPAVYGRARRV